MRLPNAKILPPNWPADLSAVNARHPRYCAKKRTPGLPGVSHSAPAESRLDPVHRPTRVTSKNPHELQHRSVVQNLSSPLDRQVSAPGTGETKGYRCVDAGLQERPVQERGLTRDDLLREIPSPLRRSLPPSFPPPPLSPPLPPFISPSLLLPPTLFPSLLLFSLPLPLPLLLPPPSPCSPPFSPLSSPPLPPPLPLSSLSSPTTPLEIPPHLTREVPPKGHRIDSRLHGIWSLIRSGVRGTGANRPGTVRAPGLPRQVVVAVSHRLLVWHPVDGACVLKRVPCPGF